MSDQPIKEKEVHVINRGSGVVFSTLAELAVLYILYRAYRYFQEAEHERIKKWKTNIQNQYQFYQGTSFFGRLRDRWFAFVKRTANRRLDALAQDGTILELDLKYQHIVEKPTPALPFWMMSGIGGTAAQRIGRQIYYGQIVETLRLASQNPKIKGLIVRVGNLTVEGPDASLAMLQELAKAFDAFKAAGKSTAIYGDTFGELNNATKTYLFASYFDAIVAPKTGMIVVPGAVSSTFFVRPLLERLHIEALVEAREKHKTAANIVSEDHMTPEHREQVEKLMNGFLSQIRSEIAKRRGVTEAEVSAWMDQALFYPLSEETVKQKLIDAIGYREEAKQELAKRANIKSADRVLFAQRFLEAAKPAEATKDLGKTFVDVAVLQLHGNVAHGEKISADFSGDRGIFSENVARQIRSLAKEGVVKAIILRINTRGGSGLASDQIVREIKFAQSKGIKVIASIGGVCASAGYMIACACDCVVAMPGSIVGSIGVIAAKLNLSNFAKEYGVNMEVIKSNELGGMFSPATGFTEKERAAFARVVDAQYAEFIEHVAKNRNMTIERVKSLAGGKVYLGDEALRLGLIDQIGTYQDVVEQVKAELKLVPEEQALRLVQVPRQQLRPWVFFSARPKNEDEKDKLYCMMEQDVDMPLGSGIISSQIANASELGRIASQATQWLDHARNGNVSSLVSKHEYMGDVTKRQFSTTKSATKILRKLL